MVTKTVYTPPGKAQRTMALYVVGRSCLPDCAKRVFQLMVWHTNGKTGQCDPSQDLLLKGTGLKSINSVSKGIAALKKAGFVQVIRSFRPNHSAAYQINWELMAEMQRRWEAQYKIEMLQRRRDREADVVAFKMRALRSSDILLVGKGAPRRVLGPTRPTPHERGGPPPKSVGDGGRSSSPMSVGVNSLEPIESNSLNFTPEQVESFSLAAEPEPRPGTGSGSAAIDTTEGKEKEGNQEEVVAQAESSPRTQRMLPLMAAIKGGWEERGSLGGDVDPRRAALARLEGRPLVPPLEEVAAVDDFPELPDFLDRRRRAAA
jgi:hypothetical protein